MSIGGRAAAEAKIPKAKAMLAEVLSGIGTGAVWETDHILAIDGYRVRVLVYAHDSGAGWSSYYDGSIKLRVDGIYQSIDARVFGQAKSRPTELGFDVPKIVAHIAYVVQLKRTDFDASEKRKSGLAKWGAVEARLREQFPDSRYAISASPKGIGIGIDHLDEKRAAAVLEALGAP